MNYVLIVVAAIIIGYAIAGMKRGMIKTVFSIFSMILALILTFLLSPSVSQRMQDNEKVMTYFSEKVSSLLPEQTIAQNAQDEFINGLMLPQNIKEMMLSNNNKENYATLAVNNFRDYITHSIACVIINAISFAVTFALITIILKVLCSILDIISKLPVLHQINKVAGLGIGVVHGIIVVWIAFIVLTIFSGGEYAQNIFRMIEDNEILRFIYDHNLLMNWLTSILGIH